MILLTGAAGKTGMTILKNLSARGAATRALVRSQQQADKIAGFSDIEPVIGDLKQPESLTRAISGVDTIYAIFPNMFADELNAAKELISIAREHQVTRFIYHSVLHPHVEDMPHHWQKMRVEEALFTSGLDFTVLQPCAYMQNILSGWKRIMAGEFSVPYNLEARISIVDLEDVAKVAAKVITEPGFSNAIFELAGPEPLSQYEVANQISEVFQQPVKAVEQSRPEWLRYTRASGMPEQQAELLVKMFEYYDKFGFVGNPTTLKFLLENEPTTFRQFVRRNTSSESEG